MKENVLQSFIKDTYKTSSLIPYIITAQALLFILLHVFDLLTSSAITSKDLYSVLLEKGSLPISTSQFLAQPWSIVTHPFIYQGLFNLVFDCIWLYWIGNMFLNYLNNRQFNTVFFGSIFIGAILFLALGFIPYFNSFTAVWGTTSFGLAALISSLTILTPNSELRLFLFGNVKFKFIAMVYLGFEFAYLVMTNKPAALVYIFITALAMLYIYQLQKGNDWSLVFKKSNRSKLRIVKNQKSSLSEKVNVNSPNQEQIDQILDKISLNGYESLSSQEKEILFRASKQGD